MASQQLVDVVIPTAKRTWTLHRAVDSVLNQTLEDWCLYVVDDNALGSPEQAANQLLVRKLQFDYDVSLVATGGCGGSCARNAGARAGRAPIIAFLDDDDEWLPGYLAAIVESYRDNDGAHGLYFSEIRYVYARYQASARIPYRGGDISDLQLMGDHVSPTSAFAVRRSVFDHIGGFDEKLPARQDYDFTLRAAQICRAVHIPKELVLVYRVGEDSRLGISSDSSRPIAGTNVVLRKINDLLAQRSQRVATNVRANQLRYLGVLHVNAGDFSMGRRLLLKSLRHRLTGATLFRFLISYVPRDLMLYARDFARRVASLVARLFR